MATEQNSRDIDEPAASLSDEQLATKCEAAWVRYWKVQREVADLVRERAVRACEVGLTTEARAQVRAFTFLPSEYDNGWFFDTSAYRVTLRDNTALTEDAFAERFPGARWPELADALVAEIGDLFGLGVGEDSELLIDVVARAVSY